MRTLPRRENTASRSVDPITWNSRATHGHAHRLHMTGATPNPSIAVIVPTTAIRTGSPGACTAARFFNSGSVSGCGRSKTLKFGKCRSTRSRTSAPGTRTRRALASRCKFSSTPAVDRGREGMPLIVAISHQTSVASGFIRFAAVPLFFIDQINPGTNRVVIV